MRKSFQIRALGTGTVAGGTQTLLDFGDVLFNQPIVILGFESSGKIRNGLDTASQMLNGLQWRFQINGQPINSPPQLIQNITSGDLVIDELTYWFPQGVNFIERVIDLRSSTNNQFSMFGYAIHPAAVAGDLIDAELTIYYDYSLPDGYQVAQPVKLDKKFVPPKKQFSK